MKIDITYCSQWNYLPQATGLVAELKAKFGDQHQFTLIPGDRGIFDVHVNGEILFSKHQEERFPKYQEIPVKITMALLED